MRLDHLIQYVDAHAEGEPSRVVVGGLVDVPGDTMLDKRGYLMRHRDDLRTFLLNEPRGAVYLSADIILPSNHPDARLGYVIIESTDYPVMSGTNTMNTATVILETGLEPIVEPVTRFNLESPAGIIAIEAECHDGKCVSVTFTNQPSFAVATDQPLEVEGVGSLRVDVAYGGAFFAFVDAPSLGFRIVPDEAADLARLGELVTRAAAEQLPVHHPQSPEIPQEITFTTWLAPPLAGGDGRNTNIVSPGRVDRSPCGTGTSARMALLHARGDLRTGQEYRSESILSTTFVGRVAGTTTVGDCDAIIPTITGRCWVYAQGQFGIHPDDPFAAGYRLSDTWPQESERSRVPAAGA